MIIVCFINVTQEFKENMFDIEFILVVADGTVPLVSGTSAGYVTENVRVPLRTRVYNCITQKQFPIALIWNMFKIFFYVNNSACKLIIVSTLLL